MTTRSSYCGTTAGQLRRTRDRDRLRVAAACDDQTERCVARAARGQRCLTGQQWGDTCELGSVCDRLDTERCIEPIGEGEPCEDGELCESGNCLDGVCRAPIDDPLACEW